VTALLGIDLGTSGVKALLSDPDGTELGRGTAGYDISTPRSGWAETDPELWWQAVRTAVRAAVGPRAEVTAIAVTGQMHGLTLISERAVVLAPAMLWLDRRAAAEVMSYRALPGHLLQALGNAPSAGRAGPLLLWLARHEPDMYRAARWQLQPKDWLRLRLTGEIATDPSDASGTLLYDLARDAWALDVADALGLRTDLLPPIRRSTELAGYLLPESAGQLGLVAGLPIAVGAADTAASLLAAGLPADSAEDGTWALLTLGTGGQWIMPASGLEPDPRGRTSLFRGVDGSAYRLAGAQNVGVTLNWVRQALGATWDELYAAATPVPVPGAVPAPRFAPWLVAEAGETSGGWTGVTLEHGREDLMRAVLVGVAGLLRDRLDDLRALRALGPGPVGSGPVGPGPVGSGPAGSGAWPARVVLGGGGSRHPAWRELLAEVLGVPLQPASTPWLTARGATLIAADIA
jgi:xylulokinase